MAKFIYDKQAYLDAHYPFEGTPKLTDKMNCLHRMAKFKLIYDKQAYLDAHYPFEGTPKLTDKMNCLHCGEDFTVGDYKVEVQFGEEYIVCPNAPKCDGTLIDWNNINPSPTAENP